MTQYDPHPSDMTPRSSSFKLARLRFIRAPPARLYLEPRTHSTTTTTTTTTTSNSKSTSKSFKTLPFELLLSITDDYGIDLTPSFVDPRVDLGIRVIDRTGAEVKGIEVSILNDAHSTSTTRPTAVEVRFDKNGGFAKIKLELITSQSTKESPLFIRFEIAIATRMTEDRYGEDRSAFERSSSIETNRMFKIIDEEGQEVRKGWEDESYVLIKAISGDVELLRSRDAGSSSGSEKVQTVLRRIHLPLSRLLNSTLIDEHKLTEEKILTILERPNLNNSTGQRLWDCAIALTCYVSLYPTLLIPSYPLPGAPFSPLATEGARSSKKPKLGKRSLTVIELGAGCALSSMVSHSLLSELEKIGGLSSFEEGVKHRIISTDIQETVETTLVENLTLNDLQDRIEMEVLNWGPLTKDQIEALIGGPDSNRELTILGTDILYNPSSHALLLETLSELIPKASRGRRRALIGYKPRTEGDDAFWNRASERGFDVRRIWMWDSIEIWKLER